MQEFSFDQSEGCFKPCDDETKIENGVLTIVLKPLGLWSSCLSEGGNQIEHCISRALAIFELSGG